MKPYPSFSMPVLAALLLCIIGTSCKKDFSKANSSDVGKNSTTSKNSKRLTAPDFKLLLGNSSTDMSSYPSSHLAAIAWTINGTTVYGRSLLKFHNVPVLANGATTPPTAAYLNLYSHLWPSIGDQVHANAGPNNTMVIRRVTSSWDVWSASWYFQPSVTTDHEVFIPHTNNAYEDLINIDITEIVRDIFYNGNNGFMIQLEDESIYNSRIFFSNQDGGTRAPYLTLIF